MNNNPVPTVSVLMPIYNAATYLKEAIDSILNQTLVDFELIIIDDGSTDDSLLILKNFAEQDDRIQLLSRGNKGISPTRNELIKLARGQYIAWMDSDDISLPNRLEIMINWLKVHNDYVAVGSKALLIDSEGNDICIWNSPAEHDEIDKWHIAGTGGGIIFPSSVMTRDAIIKAGLFDENLTGAEDLDLFLKLAESGKIANIDAVLYKYRQHITSISHSKSQKIMQDNYTAVLNACIRRGLKPPPILETTSVNDTNSPESIYIKWAWWALSSGNIATARKYALKALIKNPFSIEIFKLFACIIRGY